MRTLLALLLVLATVVAAPPASAGPCDNDVERLYCDAVASVDQLLWWLCNHGVRPACDVIAPALA